MKYYIIEHRTRGVFMGWRDEPGLFPRFSYTAHRPDGKKFYSLIEVKKYIVKVNVPKAAENLYVLEMEAKMTREPRRYTFADLMVSPIQRPQG